MNIKSTEHSVAIKINDPEQDWQTIVLGLNLTQFLFVCGPRAKIFFSQILFFLIMEVW